MSQNQSEQALKIATETCQAYFSKEFSDTTISGNDTKKEDSDWFTEKVLSGEVEKKQVTSV